MIRRKYPVMTILMRSCLLQHLTASRVQHPIPFAYLRRSSSASSAPADGTGAEARHSRSPRQRPRRPIWRRRRSTVQKKAVDNLAAPPRRSRPRVIEDWGLLRARQPPGPSAAPAGAGSRKGLRREVRERIEAGARCPPCTPTACRAWHVRPATCSTSPSYAPQQGVPIRLAKEGDLDFGVTAWAAVLDRVGRCRDV